MNTYNDNLRSSVVESLDKQETELKKVSSTKDAQMFSLYYAQGARIYAAQKLDSIWEDYQSDQKLQEQAVENNNIAINLIDSANQEKTYVEQAVTNASVGASNVQVATNAIVKLASDIGSIFTIVNAADYDTQIYNQAKQALAYMNKTAYSAELASQYAMEGSMLTSEVSAATVADEATTAGADVKAMLDKLDAQFKATSEQMEADNAELAKTSDAEKKAEGGLEDINVEYVATSKAYTLDNQELNLGVNVPNKSGDRTSGSYYVHFNPLRSAFSSKEQDEAGYPVDQYYIMVVKSSLKSTFSITMAEAIIDEADPTKKQYMEITLPFSEKKGQKVLTSELNDTDGDALSLGDDYVVFVYAKLTENYKRILNNYENYLSAASSEFSLTNQLAAAEEIQVAEVKIVATEGGKEKDKVESQTVEFSVTQNSDFKVDYRLMFLPDSRELVNGLLTAQGLESLEADVEKMENIAEKYDPQIAALEEEINSIEAQLIAYDEQIAGATGAEKTKLTKEKKALETELTDKQNKLNDLQTAKQGEEDTIDPAELSQAPGFFFNALLAEQVSAGGYHALTGEEVTNKKVRLKNDMTDNFGNVLANNKKYIPAILTVTAESAQIAGQFTSALSDFEATTAFTYVEINAQ